MLGAWAGKAGVAGGWPGISLSPCNLSTCLPWAFHRIVALTLLNFLHDSWLLPGRSKGPSGSFMASSDLNCRSHEASLLLHFIGYRADPDSVWEGNAQAPGYGKVWLVGKSSLEIS